ncbi:MAG: hypothetical protein II786_02900 [Muribaculaceae bacterium]|nr:hypothetical protein [Muribaculaceae bacterium]
MESYKSDAVTIPCNVSTIYSKLSNPSFFSERLEANLDKLPEEARENLSKVHFEADAIAIDSPMGPLRLAVDPEQSVQDRRIVFGAAQAPVKFNMIINLDPRDINVTDSVAELQLDLPFFLLKMVEPQLKEAAKKFGEMLARLPYDEI